MKWVSIAAVGKNGVMGKGLDLPWDIPEDMKFFRQSTKGHPVVMGRKTFDSLKMPLPNRLNVVITRDPHWVYPGVRVFSSLEDALKSVERELPEAKLGFVIGGAQIYREAMDWVDEIWLTEIDFAFPGDVFFPDFSEGVFRRTDFQLRERRPQLEPHPLGLKYDFVQYARVLPLS
jgi:dihydrofolate reductase